MKRVVGVIVICLLCIALGASVELYRALGESLVSDYDLSGLAFLN